MNATADCIEECRETTRSIRVPEEGNRYAGETHELGGLALPVTTRRGLYPPRLSMEAAAGRGGMSLPGHYRERLGRWIDVFVVPEGFVVCTARLGPEELIALQARILARFKTVTAAYDVVRLDGPLQGQHLLRLVPTGVVSPGASLSPTAFARVNGRPDRQMVRAVSREAAVALDFHVVSHLFGNGSAPAGNRKSGKKKSGEAPPLTLGVRLCDPAQLKERIEREPSRNSSSTAASAKTLEKLAEERLLVVARQQHVAAVRSLQASLPNFAPVIDHLLRKLEVQSLCGAPIRFSPILLLGDPGVGKSYFCRRLAEALNMAFEAIQVAGATQELHLTGLAKSWGSAGPSRFVEILAGGLIANPLIMVDEIDKASEPKIHNALLQVFEAETAARWVDHYVEVPLDLSRVLFIATANDESAMSDVLLSRFEVFDIRKPTPEQLAAVFGSIYSDEKGRQFPRADMFAQSLSAEVLSHLVGSGMSPREARRYLLEAMERAVLRTHQQRGRLAKGSVIVQPEDIPERLRDKREDTRIGFM